MQLSYSRITHQVVTRLASMIARSGKRNSTLRKTGKGLLEVLWLFGNRVLEQALAERLPVIDTRPRTTLAERVIAVTSGSHVGARRMMRQPS